MKPACWLVRRAVTEAFVRGTSLTASAAAHVERCSECQAYLADLKRIESALPSACAVPGTPATFTERTMASLPIRTRRAHAYPTFAWTRWAVPAAVVLAALALHPWGSFDVTPNVSVQTHPALAPKRIASTVGTSVGTKLPVARTNKRATSSSVSAPGKSVAVKHSTAVSKKATKQSKRRYAPAGYTPTQRRILRMASTPTTAHPATTAGKTSSTASTDYAQLAEWYEKAGDHTSAAQAYAEAYRQSQKPDMAYEAGRNLEKDGHIANALEYYLKAVEPTAQATAEPAKGSLLWNSDRGTV